MIESAFIGVTLLLLIGITILEQRGMHFKQKKIEAASSFERMVGKAVEKGGRLQLNTSDNTVISENILSAYAGLNLLEIGLENYPIIDQPPILSSADAIMTFLMMDKASSIYQKKQIFNERERLPVFQAAFDPYASASSVISMTSDAGAEANILLGNTGLESAVMAEASNRKGIGSIMGSDHFEGQAVAFIMADTALIGEELFQLQANMSSDKITRASLIAEDFMRLLIAGAIIVGAVLASIGILGG